MVYEYKNSFNIMPNAIGSLSNNKTFDLADVDSDFHNAIGSLSNNKSVLSVSYDFKSNSFIKGIFSRLKEHFDKLIFYFNEIKNNITQVINQFHKKQIQQIKFELFSISSKLKEYSFFRDEFIIFLKIKRFVEYIVDISDKDNFEFAESLLTEFSELIHDKCASVNDIEIYSESYKRFSKYLRDKEELFYTEIYVPSHKYDNTIVKITNILE